MFKTVEKSTKTPFIGYWNEKKGMLKKRFSTISDDDLNFHEKKEKEMMEMLGYKLGKSEDELREIINALTVE